MSYTFGGATGDDVNWTSGANFGTRPSVGLFTGWFMPTTLTSGRVLFAWGTVARIAIDTTTTQLRLTNDNNTTDGVFTTSNAGLAVNKWSFIAVLMNWGSAGEIQFSVWAGSETDRPTKLTMTQVTAPSGNNVASTALCIGNAGSAGTVAFQGEIENCWVMYDNSATTGNYIGGVVADGVTTATEEAVVESRFVLPLWNGEYGPLIWRSRSDQTSRGVQDYVPLVDSQRRFGNNTTGAVLVNVNGAVRGQLRGARRVEPAHSGMWQGSRRVGGRIWRPGIGAY